MYKCNCGREFETKSSLNSHARFCKEYIKVPKKVSKYKIDENLYKCECNKEFNNYQSLNAHFSHCKIHCNYLGKKVTNYHKGTMYWENKTDTEIKEIYNKRKETIRKKYNNGELKPSFLNKHHTEEFKDKLRSIRSAKYQEKGGRMNFSEKACNYMNSLNEKYNWNLQHALNGGEILCLGYWLDGYDKDLNIVFEYDEPKHYKDIENNILRDIDIKRQNKIIKELHCRFFRYNEYLNLFYEINTNGSIV